MQEHRRSIVLLRWLLFGAVTYLLFGTFEGPVLSRLALLLVLAASNVALALAPPRIWDHRILLPTLLLLDTTILTGALHWSGSVGTDFFLAYFIVLAVVAFGGGDLRWTGAGAVLIAVGYAVVLELEYGADFWRDPNVLVRLPFLFVVAILYGSFAEVARTRSREARMQKQLTGWIQTLTTARVDRREAERLVRQVLVEVDREIRGAYRVSLVRLQDSRLSVAFSSDNSELRELPLELDKYPEVEEAIRRNRPVVIGDLATDPTTEALTAHLEDLPFSSVMVCPAAMDDGDERHLLFRVARVSGGFSEVEVDVCQRLATATAALFRQAEMRDRIERAERLQMLAQMAAGVAHDFNNILCSVLMSSQLLRQEIAERIDPHAPGEGLPEDQELLAGFESIEMAAKDGMTIVERLSSWSRLDHGPVARQEVGDEGAAAPPIGDELDPETTLREAWNYAQPRWVKLGRSRDLELRWEVEDVPPVRGNGTEIREALLNLVLNAIDAMPRGGTLTLGIGGDDGMVEFRVEDTGVGIPEDRLGEVFEPLFTTKGKAGTGLGLSIVRSIATRYGGRVAVDSEEGGGSRFRFMLPAVDADVEAEAGAATGPGDAAVDADGGGRRPTTSRLLLAEDNDLVRDTITRYLEATGHGVDTAGTVREAEVLLAMDRDYSGLVLDVNLPDRASPSLYGFLEENRPELVDRVVFYSSGEAPEELADIRSRFDVRFVNKNLGLAAVGEAVEEILGRGETDRDSPGASAPVPPTRPAADDDVPESFVEVA